MSTEPQLEDLVKQFNHLKGVEIKQVNQLVCICVRNNAAEASVFLQGAQVAEYKPLNQPPVLWLSDHCDYTEGSPLRGGIPVCWPWFGDLQRNPETVKGQFRSQQPAHGFIRKEVWHLDAIECSDDKTTLLHLSITVQPREQFPYSARLELKVSVGKQLQLDFSVFNTGAESFCFTSALHSYFNISDPSGMEVRGLEGCAFLDTLNQWVYQTEEALFTFASETDRIYPNVASEIHLVDRRLNRTVSLVNTESPDLVVWNPWVDKAKRLSQFGDLEYKNMLCLESANLLDNYCQLQSGEKYKTRITIQSTPGIC